MAASKRRFYLRDPETGEPVAGLVGLETRPNNLVVKDDGVIDIDKLTEAQVDELERMAVTYGHPVTEGEPKDVK
jgi:hypothetical protein